MQNKIVHEFSLGHIFLSVLIPCHLRNSQPLPTVTPQALHHMSLSAPNLTSPHLLPSAHDHGHDLFPQHPAAGWVLPPSAPCKPNWATSSTESQQESWDTTEVRMFRPGEPAHHPAPAPALLTAVLLGFELQREPGTLQDIFPLSLSAVEKCLLASSCALSVSLSLGWTLEFNHVSESLSFLSIP